MAENLAFEEGYKVCPSCGRRLPLSEFHKATKAKDGHQSTCKECKAKYDAERKAKVIAEAQRASIDKYTGRQLLEELKRRGYRWTDMTCVVVERVDYNKI